MNLNIVFTPLKTLYLCCLVLLPNILAYHDLHIDFPGPYCARSSTAKCCSNRQDNCSHVLADTICYCDEFCVRDKGADCCPDYRSVCQGIADPIARCYHNGQYFEVYKTIRDNCNTCTCQFGGVVECTHDVCMQDEAIIDNINALSSYTGWHARNYSEFWGRKYSEGLQLRLGTKEPRRTKSMSKLTKRASNLPRHFNAIDHWSGVLSADIMDQGWCGSSWVLSTAAVASDRYAIQSKGKEIVQLSPQNILSCARRQQGCNGGHLDVAWMYLNKQGVVDEDCYPYVGKRGSCKTKRIKTLAAAGCRVPTKVERDYFYTMGPPYLLNNETDIMAEIVESGPVQATIRVYRDFFSYSGGIYKQTAANRGEPYGFHSVRIVGWGEEYIEYEPVKYWIAANTWGTWWGENGFFRILRGTNECLIEDYVLASWPHVFNSDIRKAGSRRTQYKVNNGR